MDIGKLKVSEVRISGTSTLFAIFGTVPFLSIFESKQKILQFKTSYEGVIVAVDRHFAGLTEPHFKSGIHKIKKRRIKCVMVKSEMNAFRN